MESWTFNGINLSTSAWNVERVLDGDGTPALRGTDIKIPFEHGERRIKKRFSSRDITLGMWVTGVDPLTGQLPYGISRMEQLDKNVDTLLKLFGNRNQKILQKNLRNGEVRQAMAEIQASVTIPKRRPGFAKFTVEFHLADPLFYSITKTTEIIPIASSTQQQSITNPGTAPTSYVTITMEGPLDAPRITNAENDIWVQYQGSINAGETVVINAHDYTCTKDGENYIAALSHGGDAKWAVLEAGTNALEIETGATGGDITIEFYPAYF